MKQIFSSFTAIVFLLGFSNASFSQRNFWEQAGLSNQIVTSLLVDTSGTIFAGTQSTGLYRSTNYGNSWIQINNGITDTSISCITKSSNGLLFVGTGNAIHNSGSGIFISNDNGETWNSTTLGDGYVYSLVSKNTKLLFAGTSIGFFVSTNSGVNWSERDSGLSSSNVFSLGFITPFVADVYVGTGNGVYHSTDNGFHWNRIDSGFSNTAIQSIGVFNGGGIYAGTPNNTYVFSANQWKQISTGAASSYANYDGIHSPGNIFIGSTHNGVFRSTNLGLSWVNVSTGLSDASILSLAIDTRGRIYAGTNGAGVYRGSAVTFRTFKGDTTLKTKAQKIKVKKNVISGIPNFGTVVENIFKKIGKKGRTFLGISQANKDSAKLYSWIGYSKAGDLQKLYVVIHSGAAYPIDSIRVEGRKSKPLSKLIKADSKSYNNRFWEQAVAFNLNLEASKDSITQFGLGDVLLDTNFELAGRQLRGMKLSAIGIYLDSIATYYMRYSFLDTANLGRLTETILRPINEKFFTPLDSTNYFFTSDIVTNPFGIKLDGTISPLETGFLKFSLSNNKEVEVMNWNTENVQPTQFSLEQNYPNPFNPTTAIKFSVLNVSNITLKVYNVLGQEVATLLSNKEMKEGSHEVEFDASKLSSGVYFYRLNVMRNGTAHYTEIKKMVLMK